MKHPSIAFIAAVELLLEVSSDKTGDNESGNNIHCKWLLYP